MTARSEDCHRTSRRSLPALPLRHVLRAATLAVSTTLVLLLAPSAVAQHESTASRNAVYVPSNVVYVPSGAVGLDHSVVGSGTIASAIAGLQPGGGTIYLTGYRYWLRSNLVIPANVKLERTATAYFDIAENVTLDIRGPFDEVPSRFLQGPGFVYLRSASAVLPSWFGAVGDGINDDTSPIQKAIDSAAQIFNLGAYPAAGVRYPPPVVRLRPGCYRLLAELRLYTGITLTGESGSPFTNGHTRLVMDLPGNNANILRLTRWYQGEKRTQTVTVTIQDLEFWYVTVGGTMLTPAAGVGYGNNASGQPVYRGNAIMIREQAIDVRIKRCNFFQSPDAAIAIETDQGEPSARLRNLIIDECEFDSGNRFIRAYSVEVDLNVQGCKFFSGNDSIVIVNATGRVGITDSEFDYHARVTINSSAIDYFHFTGNQHESSGAWGFLTVAHAKVVTITGNTFGQTTLSTIHVVDAEGGTISSNTIDNAGYNTPFPDPTVAASTDRATAAIRLMGCKNVVVSGNSISTTAAAVYGGFGIYTRDGQAGRPSLGNLVHGNRVSGVYNNAPWNGQSRKVNIAVGDSQSNNLQ